MRPRHEIKKNEWPLATAGCWIHRFATAFAGNGVLNVIDGALPS